MRLRCACGLERELKTIACPACGSVGEMSEQLTLNDYQALSDRTSRFTDGHHRPLEERVVIAALGLAGEAGEVADIIKKMAGHGHALDRERLKDELGDVLWYIAELSVAIGLTLEEVGLANVDKLRRRYPEGFSHEASKNRRG